MLARSDDGRRIETEQLEVIYFDIDDPANLDKLRDVQAVLLKATGRRHPESIPAFYVPGRNDMQIGYASMTGCWLIDTFKAAFTSPSVPIPPRPSVAVDVELGSPQPYSRLRPIEPVPDPISTPFVPAPVPSPATEGEPAESPGIIAKIDAAANKAESALAKFRELEAALKGEPRETVDGESDKPAGWTLLGILAAIGSFYRKIKELRA